MHMLHRFRNACVDPENAPVAQLDRVSDSDSEGRAFESHQAYHIGAMK